MVSKRVVDSFAAVDELAADLLDDLDVDRLGFGWWHGYMDAPRIALISEYVIASAMGLRESLEHADFVLNEWLEGTTADDHWTRQRLGSVPRGSDHDAFLWALQRNEHESRRETRIDLAREHFFYHLAQALDRLAALVIGIGGIETSIVHASWSVVNDKKAFKAATKLQPPEGRQALTELRAGLMQHVEDSGPTDWLPWITAQRNTGAHRAPKIRMVATTKYSKKTGMRLLQLFHRQPRWDFVESMVSGPGLHLREVVLLTDPEATLVGLLTSADEFFAAAVHDLHALWQRRRSTPRLLVQPGAQWPRVLSGKPLAFPGYGPEQRLSLDNGRVAVAPSQARRMSASGMFRPEMWRR